MTDHVTAVRIEIAQETRIRAEKAIELTDNTQILFALMTQNRAIESLLSEIKHKDDEIAKLKSSKKRRWFK